jgi:uncharacterized protein YndB with AHSA1/START domain
MKWLKRIGAVLLGALAVVGIVAAVGLAMPQDHRATSTATLAAPPDAVFARISDVAQAATWRPSIDRVEMVGGTTDRPRFREHGANGAMTMEIVELSPPFAMTTRIADKGLPFGGTWTLQIDSAGAGSQVTIEERGQIYNPIFRVVSRYLMGYNGTMETYLLDLATSFELDAPAIESTWSH